MNGRRHALPFETDLVRIQPLGKTVYISQGRTIFVTDTRGCIHDGAESGLFADETRLLSQYYWTVNGIAPEAVVYSRVDQHSALGYYIMVPPGVETMGSDFGTGLMRPESEQSLELRLSRLVGGGVHEDVDLRNFTQQPTTFHLDLHLDADFADLEETRRERQQHGTRRVEWRQLSEESAELLFDYHARHDYEHQGNSGTASIHRGLAVRVRAADSQPTYEDGRLRFAVHLPPQGRWHACVELVPKVDGRELTSAYGCRAFFEANTEYDARREAYLSQSTRFSGPVSGTLTSTVLHTLERARRDLAALRLDDLEQDDREWTVAAGLPIYLALYGRDILTVGWQSALLGPELMCGSLRVLAERQGTTYNDWRDEQPGRMLHEAHNGPLAALNYVPFAANYGSTTSSAFYPVAVAELWHWTGDKELVAPLIDPALKVFRWLDKDGDLDGDGFYEYKTRSQQGVRNQGWKDSPDAIVYEDGTLVDPPIATCETQAFAYGAKLHFSELLWWMDRKDEARRLFQEAGELKKRFNEVFWLDDEQFFAMGLDADKRPIRSISSNPAHCIAAGIVDAERVEPTVRRLMSGEMFSGWGIRTLSSQHPAYNPYSYHRGSVWPVAQGTYALGFYRFGLHDHVERLCRATFEAATLFEFYRLPEVFSGHDRDGEHPFPAVYPQANSPQAWSASATFLLLQSMLGLYAYAPLEMLLVDPCLPEWLPEITLERLRVGNATLALRFYRKPDGSSSYEVLDKQGTLHVLRQPSPWSLTASFAERVKDTLMSLLPAK